MAEYIDRQAVLDAIFPVDPENDGSDGCTVVLQNQSFTSADIEGIVCGIPASDVRTVVHAHWEGEAEICSACGERSTEGLDAKIWNRWCPDFCPHCGAQMDGDDND